MEVAGIERYGGPVERIAVADPRPLRAGEVLIRVLAAGVGNWDHVVREGAWDVGRSPPMALGVEAAGIVAAVAPETGKWAVGDQVLTHPLPLPGDGTWAPLLIARSSDLARKPPGVAWPVAGAFPVPALTARQVLDALAVRAGERLLVHGAGSVTGTLIVAFAALDGVEVLATAGPSSRVRVEQAGASAIFDYRDPGWVERVGGAAVDAVANAVPGGAATVISTVRDGGRLGTITSDPPLAERGIDVRSVYVQTDATQLQGAADLLATGRLPFSVGAEFEFADAHAALARAVAGRGGAVVLSTGGD
jgi:NADPH:quinone reductase-like Zn-dependent oxidoreductase